MLVLTVALVVAAAAGWLVALYERQRARMWRSRSLRWMAVARRLQDRLIRNSSQ